MGIRPMQKVCIDGSYGSHKNHPFQIIFLFHLYWNLSLSRQLPIRKAEIHTHAINDIIGTSHCYNISCIYKHFKLSATKKHTAYRIFHSGKSICHMLHPNHGTPWVPSYFILFRKFHFKHIPQGACNAYRRIPPADNSCHQWEGKLPDGADAQNKQHEHHNKGCQ